VSQAKRANMLYKNDGPTAMEEYLRGQGFSGPRLHSLMNAAAVPRVGKQRGPNSTSGHAAKIRQVADELELAGNKIEAGGGRQREKLIRTPDGFKFGRRPDILYRTPGGRLRGVNVGLGRRMPNGRIAPIPREAQALQDLNGPGGLPTIFVPYN
jgi:hypothetical protein